MDWSIEDRNRTIADGLRSQPSALTFAHLQQVIDGMITVSENEIRAAVRELAVNAHLVSEPSGAVALAAYRQGATPPGRTVMVLSGGNVEPSLLADILRAEILQQLFRFADSVFPAVQRRVTIGICSASKSAATATARGQLISPDPGSLTPDR